MFMSKSLKAVLLSAFVFPGIGHFSLKKPVQGVLLSGVAIVCLYLLLTTSIDIAQQMSIKIQSGEIPMDVEKINEMVSQQLEGGDGQRVNIPSLILLICWIAGIVDSFRIGWSQDKSDDSSDKRR
jgi:TM2 domain-containing membrane protein YozV